MRSLIEELRSNSPAITGDVLRRAANRIERLEARVKHLELILVKALPVVRLALYPKLADRITEALAQQEDQIEEDKSCLKIHD